MSAFPTYHQLDSMDCGATCLRIICKYYGKSYGARFLRERCHTTRNGVSMLAISDLAEQLGFRTAGAKITFEQLSKNAPLPCLVHWNQQHFVVVYKIKKKVVYVSDPAIGLLEYSVADFLKGWQSTTNREGEKCGIVLLLEPTPRFYQEEDSQQEKGLHFRYLLSYLKPYKRYIVQVFISLLLGSGLSLLLPFITQSVVDIGIGTNDIHFIWVLLMAQMMLVVGQTANTLIRNWLMLHTTTRLSITFISDYLSKLMRLPIAFFDSKRLGDILQRIGDYGRIQSFLTETLLSIVMAVVTFIVYGAVMASYDVSILLIFLVGSGLYTLWIVLFMRERRKLDYMQFQQSAQNQSTLVQLVTGMQEIKLNNCEKQKRWEYEHIQIKLFKINIKGLRLQQAQTIGGLLIDQTKNILISVISATAVISGDITLGMMTAIQYIIGQLNAPISQFISFLQATQDAKLSLERLNEIYAKDDEESLQNNKIQTIPPRADLILRNLTFQYEGEHSEKVLDDIHLTIPHGKVTAIVGTSGSGKTTLLKLLLGFYAPTKGEVLLGNTPLSQYNTNAWRACCGVVMQEGFIFSDTIANNIGVMDESPDMIRVQEAVTMTNLTSWIQSLPLGYNTRIGMDGHGVSTGQKQRLLIARAVYKNAPYLFLDEATNSLDANNEKMIMENMNRLFHNKTVVIVAHRLSTVKNADNIVVINEGKIIEQGTHDQLVGKKGQYYELVKNQLELGQ